MLTVLTDIFVKFLISPQVNIRMKIKYLKNNQPFEENSLIFIVDIALNQILTHFPKIMSQKYLVKNQFLQYEASESIHHNATHNDY